MSAAGFDNMRIEQEEKLLVPMEIADEVLAFLKHRYVEDKTRLQELNPRFTSSFDVEDFTDVYYDSPSLQLLALQSGVRHRKRVNLSRPEDVKSGRELMQIKLNNISSNALERGEIKCWWRSPSSASAAPSSGAASRRRSSSVLAASSARTRSPELDELRSQARQGAR